jgi:hypothetical protein
MVEVRVRQDDGVDRRRIDGQRLPIPQPQFLQPLKQPAIDEHPPPVHLEQMLGPGHRARSPEKRQR